MAKEEAVVSAAVAEHKGRKRAKKEADAPATVEDGGVVVGDEKVVVVEACTQCRHFKIRALKVKEDLESVIPGVSVIIKLEKNMPRPFTVMKKLGMDEVIKDIVKKIS